MLATKKDKIAPERTKLHVTKLGTFWPRPVAMATLRLAALASYATEEACASREAGGKASGTHPKFDSNFYYSKFV